MDASMYWIAAGAVLLLARAEAEDIVATAGSDVTFLLPLFQTCPNLKLSDPNDVLLLTVTNGKPRISDHMINRVELGRVTEAVTFTLKKVECNDEGTYYLEELHSLRVPACEKFYSIQLDIHGRAYWLSWGPWSACNDNTSCKRGLRLRTRECTIPGFCCHGSKRECETEVTKCLYFAWENWSSWSGCSATCGTGYKNRHRECYDSTAEDSTLDQCTIGEREDVEKCTMAPCAVLVVWSAWSEWTGCSVTCGTGRKRRHRKCLDDTTGRSTPGQCMGREEELEGCNLGSCEVPVVKSPALTFSWTAWSHWTTCSKSCDTGWQTRDRKCNDQYNRVLSGYCTGDSAQNATCNILSCNDSKTSSSSSGEATVSLPLWSIVGGAAGILIVLLLIVIVSLIIVLRRKSRKKSTNRTDTTHCHKSEKETLRPGKQSLQVPPNTRSDTRMSRVSDYHVYAEINDDDVYVKTEKSLSVVTIDNPYAPYPRSASPGERNTNNKFQFSTNSGQQETSFTYVNTPEELPVKSGNKQRLDSAGYLVPLKDVGQMKGKKSKSYKK